MDISAWITVTLLVDIIALVFQIAAYAAPMWVWVQLDPGFIGVGLWYTVGCIDASCATLSFNSAGLIQQVPFLVVRVLQSVGMAGLLGLTIFLFVLKIGYNGKWRSMKTASNAALAIGILTFLVLLGSAVVFAAYYYVYFMFVQSHGSSSLPWSALMSFLAAIIVLIVCIFLGVNCRPHSYHGNALPMSGDTKMELHPQIQNGHVNRYFNQTPYIEDRGRYVEDNRSNRSNYHDDRLNTSRYYENRGYHHDAVEPPVAYQKPTSSQFRDNRDRDMGHTIYTEKGFSYLESDPRRYERDDHRYMGRQVAVVEYGLDEYFDPYSRGRSLQRGGGPDVQSAYIYRPHKY